MGSTSLENDIYLSLYTQCPPPLAPLQAVVYSLGGAAWEVYRQGLTQLIPRIQEVGGAAGRCAVDI